MISVSLPRPSGVPADEDSRQRRALRARPRPSVGDIFAGGAALWDARGVPVMKRGARAQINYARQEDAEEVCGCGDHGRSLALCGGLCKTAKGEMYVCGDTTPKFPKIPWRYDPKIPTFFIVKRVLS